MRWPTLLLFLFVHLISAEILDVSIYSTQPVPTIVEAVAKHTKLWSRDNRFISVEVDEVVCEATTEEIKCTQIKEGTILIAVNDRTQPNRISEIEVREDELKSLEKSIKQLFVQFASMTFSSRAADARKETNWWAPLFPTLLNLYHKNQIATKDELQTFIEHDLHNYLHVIYYKQDGDFINFEAVLNGARAFSKVGVEFTLVDCTIDGLCEQENLPLIQSFYHASPYMRYEGSYKPEKMSNWAQTLKTPILSHMTEDIVPMYRSGIVPGVDGIQDTVTMLFIPSKKPLVYKNYKKFAKDNHGKYHLTAMVNKQVEQWKHQPAFITMKPKEEIQKAFVMYEDLTWDRMEKYLSNGLQPSIHILDSAEKTLEVISQELPLVIFFDPDQKKNVSEFKTLAAEFPIRSELTLFAVIQSYDMFATYFSEQFSLPDVYPRYVLLNTEKNCLRSKLIAAENQAELKHWIESSLKEETCDHELKWKNDELNAIARWERNFMARRQYTEIVRENKVEHEEL